MTETYVVGNITKVRIRYGNGTLQFVLHVVHGLPIGRISAEPPVNEHSLCLNSEVGVGRASRPYIVSALTFDKLPFEGRANPSGYEPSVSNLPGVR